ncbi:MAG: hypothetical protein DRI01_08520 [Chloroflexi bacterium]|nr:MAG: hypothetical protein DRI01_08520 [Chloroflexota bacterium]
MGKQIYNPVTGGTYQVKPPTPADRPVLSLWSQVPKRRNRHKATRRLEREAYLELASLMDWPLCSFCKFYTVPDNVAIESPCDVGDALCAHPLNWRLELYWGWLGLEPSVDCWAFRPSHPLDFCADVVGVCMEKKWESAVWWQEEDGQWLITEVRGY